MTNTLFTDITCPDSIPEPQQQALRYWHNYGSLRCMEAWRWTPLAALREPARKLEAADYQFSLDDSVEENFGRDPGAEQALLSLKDAPFAALNLGLLADALLLRVPDKCEITELNALNIDMYACKVQTSRLHIRAGMGSKSAFWIDCSTSHDAAQLPVITIAAATGAEIDVVLLFNGCCGSAQLAQVQIRQAAGSRVRVNTLQSGGALARLDIAAELDGEDSRFAFGGVQLLEGSQIADYHLNVRHLSRNSESRQIVRGALDGAAQGYFDGMIYVARGAQKTDARQDSRYILLAGSACSHSVPRLEIYADDVQCAHGATTGKVDEEALFYLRSRGISLNNARKILILSFLHEAVVVEHPAVAEAVHETISAIWLGEQDEAA